MGRILITGATGFIGTALLEYIQEIDVVFHEKLLILSSSREYTDIETLKLSLDDTIALKRVSNYDIETVFHIGAFIPKMVSEANRVDDCNRNIFFTANVLNALPESVQKIIFISTIDIYQPTLGIIDEMTPTVPTTLYGASKLYSEKLVEAWSEQHGKICQVLRLGHIYGRGEAAYKKLIPEFIRQLLDDKMPVIYTDGQEKRSYLHVRDCVRAIWQAQNLEKYQGPINVVSKNAYPVLEIARKLQEISRKKIKIEILGKESVTKDFIFDNTKMKELLIDETVSLDQGLADEYEYFKSKRCDELVL